MRRGPTLAVLRVLAAVVALLGGLGVALDLVARSTSAGAGALTLPDPVPITAVDYSAPPLKVLLVGDSMAGSLGVGLSDLAPAYNITLANAGKPGCSASMDGLIELEYFIDKPGWPCIVGDPSNLMRTWQAWVDAFRPDVVVYLARSDTINQQVDGQWTYVGHRVFDRWFSARLNEAISIFTSRGAKVVLMTVPISDEPTINARPEDNPIRSARDGALLADAALEDPSSVSIYNLAQLLTPDFRYRASTDDLPLRCTDGVHFTQDAGMVVGADLFPRLWRLVGTHRVRGGGRWALGPFPSGTPSWYAKLNCP